MKEAECGTSWGQAHTKQWSSGNLVLIFTLLGMKVDRGGGGGWGRTREGEGEKKERQKRGNTAESKGLASCQLDSLTPFGGEQTNRGISWADSVDLS